MIHDNGGGDMCLRNARPETLLAGRSSSLRPVRLMASFTFEVESRPDGRVKVTVYGDVEYPDGAHDLANRAASLHKQALADWHASWYPAATDDTGDGDGS